MTRRRPALHQPALARPALARPARPLIMLPLIMLAACSMDPRYERPAPPVPQSWPSGPAYKAHLPVDAPHLRYADIFTDARLRTLISTALINNRDLRIAAANIAAARAQYRIQRAEQLPRLDAATGVTRTDRNATGNAGAATSSGSDARNSYAASVGVPAFELDLFGRVASLTRAQQNRYFASEAAARATRITLVGDIAEAWLAYGADASLLAIARDTVASAQRSVTLTRARLQGGIAPRTDLRQAEQVLATALADEARQKTALAQDVNALQLLLGAPVDPSLLPGSIDEAAATIRELPADLNSRVLLGRPDIIQAEYGLRAANADIGAARAALFPTISLTGALSTASSALSRLFTGGALSWSAGADIGWSIFQGGAGRARVRASEAERDRALAAYEKAIQTGFREVADALARRGTMADEVRATRLRADASADSFRLTEARYRGGVDSYLTSLDAQRSLYSARRALAQVRLEEGTNLVALYRALAGDDLLPE